MFELIAAFLKLLSQIPGVLGSWKSVKTWWQQKNAVEDLTTPESAAKRFIQLFEAHGVLKTQIPKFFGHDLKIADFQTEEKLLEKLTDELLQDACDLFCIRRQWLDGEDEQIYPLHDFYKKPRRFKSFIEETLISRKAQGYFLEVFFIRSDKPAENFSNDCIMIIEEVIGEINGKIIYKYHFCDNWKYFYWKARVYLTACAAIASNIDSLCRGYIWSDEWFKKIQYGQNFLDLGYDNAAKLRSNIRWDPAQLIIDPATLVKGIDYGQQHALDLWLKLFDEGYMLPEEGYNLEGIKRSFIAYKFGFSYLKCNLPSNVNGTFTMRHGGMSKGVFTSLNLGDHVGDDPAAVAENRARVQQHIGDVKLHWLEQVHGTEVADLDEKNPLTTADAAVTSQSNTACVVMTADCLPVLFCDQNGTTVAGAHAGWRGLANGVLENTVAALCEKAGCSANQIIAWLGPAIGSSAFEVGDEVRKAFLAHDSAAESAFQLNVNSKWLADIYQLARQRLVALGVQDISGGECCTFTDSERFFSYRRDGQTGRMASVIWLS